MKMVCELVRHFPPEEKYGMTSQITRAAVSIPANIAEGSGRQTDKDYGRFVQHSLGSAFEVQTYLIIAQEMKWVNSLQVKDVEELLEREIMMLHRFLNILNKPE